MHNWCSGRSPGPRRLARARHACLYGHVQSIGCDGYAAALNPLFTSETRRTTMTSAKGLEGVVAASTAISHVFGEEGRLVYRGYEISELAGKASYEEVCFLLWNGHLPNHDELDQLNTMMRT